MTDATDDKAAVSGPQVVREGLDDWRWVLDKLVAYNASKAGVLMMGKALAKEWANKGINVNVICPGWIATELNTEWLDTPAGQALVAKFPHKRVMQPADLEHITLFLLSDASAMINGGGFELDDGQSL